MSVCNQPEDIMKLLGESMPSGSLLLNEKSLGENFFDLGTGLAGELFQKFVNYQSRLAVVVADSSAHGARFRELVLEHETHPMIRFFPDSQLAKCWLENPD